MSGKQVQLPGVYLKRIHSFTITFLGFSRKKKNKKKFEYGWRNIKSYQKTLSNLLLLGNILKGQNNRKKGVVDYVVAINKLFLSATISTSTI